MEEGIRSWVFAAGLSSRGNHASESRTIHKRIKQRQHIASKIPQDYNSLILQSRGCANTKIADSRKLERCTICKLKEGTYRFPSLQSPNEEGWRVAFSLPSTFPQGLAPSPELAGHCQQWPHMSTQWFGCQGGRFTCFWYRRNHVKGL